MNIPPKIAEVLETIIKKKGLRVAEVLKNCNLGKDVIGSMKRGNKPNAEIIAILANYLEVSTDYLLGVSDDPTPPGKKNTPFTVEDALRTITSEMNLSEKDIGYLKHTAELLELKNNIKASNEETALESSPKLT